MLQERSSDSSGSGNSDSVQHAHSDFLNENPVNKKSLSAGVAVQQQLPAEKVQQLQN